MLGMIILLRRPFSRNGKLRFINVRCGQSARDDKSSLAARPYFVFARGGGRKVGSSRMCKFHTSRRPMKSLLHHFSAVKGVYFGADTAWLLELLCLRAREK